jgi:hypothetical protein
MQNMTKPFIGNQCQALERKYFLLAGSDAVTESTAQVIPENGDGSDAVTESTAQVIPENGEI